LKSVKGKIAAVLTAIALSIGAITVGAGELRSEARASARSRHDAAYGVLQANPHAKRSPSLRDLHAVGVAAFALARPADHGVSLARTVFVAAAYAGGDRARIRGPPQT
jgi:hypothetical protein